MEKADPGLRDNLGRPVTQKRIVKDKSRQGLTEPPYQMNKEMEKRFRNPPTCNSCVGLLAHRKEPPAKLRIMQSISYGVFAVRCPCCGFCGRLDLLRDRVEL